MGIADKKLMAAKKGMALARSLTKDCTAKEKDAVLWAIHNGSIAVGIELKRPDFARYAADGLGTLRGGRLSIFKKARILERDIRNKARSKQTSIP
jgi:hypothetical protein